MKTSNRYFLLTILLLAFILPGASAQITRYVKEGGTGTGTSWADASGSLQAMLDAVKANSPDGGSIWVAAGTYTGQFNLSYGHFGSGQVPITLLGGFPNTGTPGLMDRNSAVNLTNLTGGGVDQVMFLHNIGDTVIIDGFILKDGKADNNNSQPIAGGGAVENEASYAPRVSNPHFIDCKFINNTALQRGGAVMSTGFAAGGVANIKFTRCEFTGNSATGTGYLDGGGAVGIYGRFINSPSQAYGLFVDCTFTNNTAHRGGAIMVGGEQPNTSANIELVNANISGNNATLVGGGIYVESQQSEVKITNSRITGNRAETGNGGGLSVYNDSYNQKVLTTIWNTTFSGNKSALAGGAIFNDAAGSDTTLVAFRLTNTISWNNQDNTGIGTASSSYAVDGNPSNFVTIINYSLLQAQNPAGTGNLDGINVANDPDFVTSLDPNTAPSTGGDFHLQSSSPVINVGTNTGFPADMYDVDGDMNTTEPTPDLDTQERIVNTTIDFGPYEFTGGTPSLAISGTPSLNEGNAGPTAFTFTVTRTGNIANQSSASWAVTGSGANPANGADFSGGSFPSGTVTFPAGSSVNQTITVNVNGDVDVEPDEGFTVTLSNPVNATITTATANGTIQNDDAAPGYCAAGADMTSGQKISNVQFNTINNASTSTAGYEDFTAVTTTVQQGSTHAFTGTISNADGFDQIIVWIDFNQDLDFDDAGEQVFISPQGIGPHTGNITILANATTGNTRMRVRLHNTFFGPNTTPCGNSLFGQVEDYTISVIPVAVAAKTLDFDGTDDYVALPANLTASLTNFTFEAWVFWDGANYWQRIMDFGEDTDVYMYLTPKGSPGDNPIFAITTASSGGEERIVSSVPAAIGQWQHYAVVMDFDSSIGTMYLDGMQVGQNTNMTLAPVDLGNLPNNYLGKSQWPDPYFDGKMDEVRLWDYAKTASEVTCQKDAELTGTEPGLVAYFNFNQGFANSNNPGVTTLDDLTANNNDGTLTNFALTGNGSNWTEPGAPVMGTPSCCPAGNIIYVNDDAGGANNGTSWTDAYTDLQNAIAEANNCPNITQIWVAAGTYKPTTGTDRTISFNLKNNLAIYGGFLGTETLFSERNWFLNITVLSGDIGTPGDNSDNSYHVVRNENINNTAILDGFRIFYGNANGTGEYLWGGGVYNTNASPTIKQCGIIENNALEGGGMANHTNSSPSIINCGISFNHATLYKGGGIANSINSSPVIVNTIFRGNTAAEWGGAIFNTGNCNPELMNCTLVANSAIIGGAIYSQLGSTPLVTNSIFWDNPGGWDPNGATFSYSLLQDATCPGNHTCGAGMIYNTDPLFVSPTDAHLQSCSPAKDKGTATGAPATDFDGDSRPQGAGIDMGYDENGAFCCPGGNILYVNDDAAGANNGTSWTNAFNSLQDALAATANCPGVTQIWVAAGTYKPTTSTDRTISFNMKNNLAIYGGFLGTETLLSERNWFLNITALSGDIGTPGDNSDNSYHVVRNENINNTAILDGFRILYGNANGTGEYLWGGGIFNINNASPTIKQCGIIENNAQEGGGIANRINSSPTIDNCGISFNHATVYKGGGIYNENSSSPVIVNTNFRGNTAAEVGGAIYNTGNCNPELMNCTLVGNSANTGGVIASFGPSANPVVSNSIFWNNTGSTALGNPITFSYSLLQDATCPAGHTCGTGMIYNIDPLFVSPTDAHLQACSPAKNVGTSTGAPATDLEGDARPQGTGIDMGMDESTTLCDCPNTRVVSGNIPTDTYNAEMDLTSNALVKDMKTVVLKAGNQVLLDFNFEVELGGVLDVLMDTCVPPPTPPGPGTSDM